MSIHYLVDPSTTNADIIDVVIAESGQTDATGATLIRIPDGVGVDNQPSNLTDLLTEKYNGLLAYYAGFTQIVADSCLDASNVSLTDCSRTVLAAGRVNHAIDAGGTLSFNPVTIGGAVEQCVVVWETYEFLDSNDKTTLFQRVYSELNTSSLDVTVGFNGLGGSFLAATSDTVLNVPVPDQGTDLTLVFVNNTGNRVYLGSWAVILP